MQVAQEMAGMSSGRDTILTIGVFDGVHLGHKYLISELTELARERGLASGVVTFRRHPAEILAPERTLSYLTTATEKERLLRKEGVDAVVTLFFTAEMARLDARDFAVLLKEHLGMRGLVIGPDFALGKGRKGNATALIKLGGEMDFTVKMVSAERVNGEEVSSTVIREVLSRGDIEKVNQLFGRNFRLSGRVARGHGIGLEMGFPTTNLSVDPRQAIPADGVYVTWAGIDGKQYGSMTNIGMRPTFGGKVRTIESYILNFESDLYGHEMDIDFVARLRSEQRFTSSEELKVQIEDDVERGKTILGLSG